MQEIPDDWEDGGKLLHRAEGKQELCQYTKTMFTKYIHLWIKAYCIGMLQMFLGLRQIAHVMSLKQVGSS